MSNWLRPALQAAARAPVEATPGHDAAECVVLDLRSSEAHALKKKGISYGLTHHSHVSQTQLQALLNNGWSIEKVFSSSYIAMPTGALRCFHARRVPFHTSFSVALQTSMGEPCLKDEPSRRTRS